jgi:hypothetical protein
MYSSRDKIVKKNKVPPTETEDEVAKAIIELENTVKEESIHKIVISGAQYLTEDTKKILHIFVPFKIFPLVRQNFATVVPFFENKFKCPVVIVGQRTILSKYGNSY